MDNADSIPNVLRGAAAVQEALDVIGNDEGKGDKDLARVVVEHEMAIRERRHRRLRVLRGLRAHRQQDP